MEYDENDTTVVTTQRTSKDIKFCQAVGWALITAAILIILNGGPFGLVVFLFFLGVVFVWLAKMYRWWNHA